MDRYMEALEQARNYYPDNLFLDTIFPELRESEDERIRKALLELVSNDKANGYTGFYEKRGITCDDAIAYLEKQKHAEWSEEEEKIRAKLLSYFNGFEESTSFGRREVIEIRHFLKSLRPQPKAELTLLDKNIINAAVAFVEQNDHFNCWGGIDKHTVINALHSLKPHWKPSEEQMVYLKEAIKKFDFCDAESAGLQALYEQLKKL